MGIEDVRKEILAEAQGRATESIESARKERDQLIKQSEHTLATQQNAMDLEADNELAHFQTREMASANFAAKSATLRRQKELVDELKAEVVDRLSKLDSKQRKAHIQALLKQASKGLQISTVYVAQQDIKLVDDYKAFSAGIIGGAIVENAEMTERIDLSYDTIIDDIFDRKLKEIVKELLS